MSRPAAEPAGCLRLPPAADVLLAAGLAVATVCLYLPRLSRIGWGNPYYAAVAQSGAHSWRALVFASPDLLGATATDKPPLAFWPMALAVRAFGLHGWVVDLPQLVEAAASVVVLYATVRLVRGRLGSTVAAVALATTPVTYVLARYDDPDMLLMLLVVVAAHLAVRAGRSTGDRWPVVLGVAVGLGFLTKWGAVLIPLPALFAYVALSRSGRTTRGWRTAVVARLGAVIGGAATLTALAGVLVLLLPGAPFPDDRTGSPLDLILGQNGFSRLGYSTPSAGAIHVSGLPGPLRLLTQPFAGQIGWLVLPAVVIVALSVFRAVRAPRGGAAERPYLLFGGWFVLTATVFSVMGGSIHPYYTVLLAPALAGLFGLAASDTYAGLAGRRPSPGVTALALALVAGCAAYDAVLLGRYEVLEGWSAVVACAAGFAAVAVFAGAWADSRAERRPGMSGAARVATGSAAAVALLAGPVGFSLATVSHQVSGANPLAGPVADDPGVGAYSPAFVAALRGPRYGPASWVAASLTSAPSSMLQLQTGLPVLPLGGYTGRSGYPPTGTLAALVASHRLRYLLLTGPFAHGRVAPPGLRETAVQSAVNWARAHGCPVSLPGAPVVVLDLRVAPPCLRGR